MRTWPSWHPGQELKAEHLLGLEDFLLARATLQQERWHGVEAFDEKASLELKREPGALAVEVQRLRGVTPGGHPIWLEGEEKLAELIPMGDVGALIFDLAVEINDPDQPEKLVLRAVAASDVPGFATPVRRHPRRLELGRFRWLSDGSVEMLRRPLVRCFAALTPHDNAWRLWVEPFEACVRNMLEEVEREKPPFALPVVAWANEVQRLAFEWPALALPELLRRLRLVQWLRLAPKERPSSTEAQAQQIDLMREDLTGDELPELLLEALGGERARTPVDKSLRRLKPGDEIICTWVDRFWECQFLQPFSGGLVELHVPTQANPPQSLSLQNRELTYVRSVDGDLKGTEMVYALGALPIKAGSVFRFRMNKVVPSGLNDAEFHFLRPTEEG